MKRVAMVFAVVLALSFGAAHAETGGTGGTTNIESLKKFQTETATLRDELTIKFFELQNEYAKTEPDYNRIATIRKEIVDIQTKLQASADKYGVWCPMCGMGGGITGQGMMGRGMMGGGMMGQGMMMGPGMMGPAQVGSFLPPPQGGGTLLMAPKECFNLQLFNRRKYLNHHTHRPYYTTSKRRIIL